MTEKARTYALYKLSIICPTEFGRLSKARRKPSFIIDDIVSKGAETAPLHLSIVLSVFALRTQAAGNCFDC